MTYEPFTSDRDSHEHSLQTLDQFYEFDDFMESIGSVLDLGAGSGLDTEWWATRTTRDDQQFPLNIKCTAVDLNDLTTSIKQYPNVSYNKCDFEKLPTFTKQFDLLWSHDSFQYALNPLTMLSDWYHVTANGGMLVIVLPQTTNIEFNQERYDQRDGNYFNYTMVSLLHMLAVSGWDCSHGFFKKDPNDCWLHAAVYKSEHPPMDPKTTKWYDLVAKKLLPKSADASINKYGYLRQQDLVLPWINGSIRWFGEN